jgi:hypothetical protein
MSHTIQNPTADWKQHEILLFRFFAIFFVLIIFPFDYKFYQTLFSIHWLELHWHDLFDLAKYQPQFFTDPNVPVYGLKSFVNWGFIGVLGIIGTVIWGILDKTTQNYDKWFYWLRVLVRYRLATALVVYGFIKFFPLQMPYPSLSNLLTNYGDFFAWKIYFQTVGIAPKYEAFLGFVEILCGILIFNRKTTTFGAGIVIGFLGNVAAANGFYEIGEQSLSTLLVLFAAFLISYDIPRLWDLLYNEKLAIANKFQPDFSNERLRQIRIGLRSAFLVFTLFFGIKTFANFKNDPYKIPKTPGLSAAYGVYDVKTFIVNGDTLPYSKTDKKRWQDVIFEKWSTLTIKQNRPVKIDFSSAEIAAKEDIDRNYELAGFAGRHYFHYKADTINHTLALQNKNSNHRDEKLFLKYTRPTDSTIVLEGIDEKKDTIYAELVRINKKYLMFEGRRKEVKL